MAATVECTFVAVVLDSFGTVSDETRELLHHLAQSHTQVPH